jgi:hypothetical protein
LLVPNCTEYVLGTKKVNVFFKIKGISLTVTNLETFTFENMARIVSYFATVNDFSSLPFGYCEK